MDTVTKSDKEWRETLSPEQYVVLREKATEEAFTGQLLLNAKTGIYTCAACGNELFSSKTKFDSGCGWPSFFDPENQENIILQDDRSLGVHRTEVLCRKCGGHLGHLFDDAPRTPTGQRYCINSAALHFQEKSE